ncbi:tripartite tricarboxylate transporter substrate binding protein [Psychrobacillus antarcticus]|uniref:tripartite tricarboxylate transporter substrate binding protein n=1 Tax=Psychrobacillus antarcticus TaxID=2879115 RepID=UPI002407E80B|nr:tripartite tricarboxylate transporter substrate-binding protein [Psychrobacillus antarcticus]
MKSKWLLFLMLSVLSVLLIACSDSNEGAISNESETAVATDKNEDVGYEPEKPVVIYAPGGAGGGLDTTARAVTKVMEQTKLVAQPFSVENVPGGGQTTGLSQFITNDPTNEGKLLLPSAPIVINYLRNEAASPYSYADMKPIAQLTTDYGAIVVKADSPYQTLEELYTAINADTSSITFAGGSGAGSMDHIIAMMPAIEVGTDPKAIKYISYDAGGDAMVALLGGHSDALTTGISEVGQYLEAGEVRILGVSSPERLDGIFSEVLTFKESGYDAEFTNWRGLFAVKDISDEAVKYWEDHIEQMVETPEWQSELEKNSWGNGFKKSDDFTAYLQEQDKVVLKILKEMGMAK